MFTVPYPCVFFILLYCLSCLVLHNLYYIVIKDITQKDSTQNIIRTRLSSTLIYFYVPSQPSWPLPAVLGDLCIA